MLHIHINEHMNAYFKNVHMKYCLCLGRRMKLLKCLSEIHMNFRHNS
uniref:Uncharacterized protein n=1 Tax=Anguilla anguilla TaxID=7936 RepID=A0A0E9VZK3_ANGAN